MVIYGMAVFIPPAVVNHGVLFSVYGISTKDSRGITTAENGNYLYHPLDRLDISNPWGFHFAIAVFRRGVQDSRTKMGLKHRRKVSMCTKQS